MTLTNFPNGISSFGIPVLGGTQMPLTGTYFFVDPVNGSDGNKGLSPKKAFKTLLKAHNSAKAGNNDVVYLIGNGAASGTARQDATLVWSKDATHLIGIAAPTQVSQRARIAATSGVDFTPLVSVTGNGCIFQNVQAFHGYATAEAQICWAETGERNYYENVHFAGMGDAIAGDQAGSASLSLTGDGERTFVGCTIGLDTVARSTSNGEILLASAAVRDTFIGCTILSFADNAAHVFVKANTASAIDRWIKFNRCEFLNAVKSTATTMSGAFLLNASVGGFFLLDECTIVGATDIEATAATNNIFINGGPPVTTTTGLAINNVT